MTRACATAARVPGMEFMVIALLGTALLAVGPMAFAAWENRKRR